MAFTVREFAFDVYRLINASNPTTPLHGDDQELCIRVLNRLLRSYAANGLMLTIAKSVSVDVAIGQKYVVCGPADFMPTPDIPFGRLANVEEAWLLLEGVTYPLVSVSRETFLASFKYEPLKGLPRLLIVYPDTDVVNLQIYPAPSQVFNFNLRAKFQLPTLTANDDMSLLPEYYMRYLLYACARDVAQFKGRNAAWTPDLEQQLVESRDIMISASEVNLEINGDRASLLNGAWRIRSGI